MLASDVANPEFVGAKDPDAALHVEFYWHEPIDDWTYRTTGEKKALQKQIFVMIQRGGDQTTTVRTFATDDHKKRFPRQWLFFQSQEGILDSKNLPGTPLESWHDEFDSAQDRLHELKARKFFTVESIAMASDQQIQGVGIGGTGLRERAKVFLRKQMSVDAKAEIAKRDEKIADLEQKVNQLLDLVSKKK